MKIAIVCGHFLPTMGYIEVHLANAFHQLGNEVQVFTSRIIPTYVKQIGKLSDNTPYKIVRLNANFSMGQMVKPKGLVNAVEEFGPQLVVCIGVGKLFPKPMYQLKNRKFKLVTLLGDNEETYTTSGRVKKLKNILVKEIFKKKIYVRAIKKSDVLFPYTPSTIDVITQFISVENAQLLRSKSKPISLGFDEEQFYFDELERKEQRKQLGVSENENLLITATRVVPEKRLEQIIDLVDAVNSRGLNLHYLIVGFQEDKYGKELSAYIAQKAHKNRITCKPFSGTSQLRKYYNAADAAIFNRAAISIFEALATGLYLLLPQQRNISHILDENNGCYFNQLKEEDFVGGVIGKKEDRLARVKSAEKFSYRNLTHQIIDSSEV